MSLKNVTYDIRVRELCSLTPTFVGDDSDRDEEGSMGTYVPEEEEVNEENDVESIVCLMT